MLASYHQLGIIAHLRGRLDEAEDWFRKALAIEEELGDRSDMAVTYQQLGLLAEAAPRLLRPCLEHPVRDPVRGVSQPAHQDGPQPLPGSPANSACPPGTHLQQITGHPVPQQIRDYISSPHNDESSQP